jgi:hypothetical protein
MRAAGVSADTRVVVYDDAGGSVAARLWWLLTGYGHARVHVLDGGTPRGSRRAARPRPRPPRSRRGASPRRSTSSSRWSTATSSRPCARAPSWVLLDARVAERYRGEVEPVDARPGHIPARPQRPVARQPRGRALRRREGPPRALPQARRRPGDHRPLLLRLGRDGLPRHPRALPRAHLGDAREALRGELERLGPRPRPPRGPRRRAAPGKKPLRRRRRRSRARAAALDGRFGAALSSRPCRPTTSGSSGAGPSTSG